MTRRAPRRSVVVVLLGTAIALVAWLFLAEDARDFDAAAQHDPDRTDRAALAMSSDSATSGGRTTHPSASPRHRATEAATAEEAPGVARPEVKQPAPTEDAVQRVAMPVQELRPAAVPGSAPTVVARDWTPARDALAGVAAHVPGASVPRGRDAPEEPAAGDAAEDLVLAKTHGLRGDYFDLLDGEITQLPDVAKLPPSFSRIDVALDFDTDESFAVPFDPDTFAVRWTGFLTAPEEGDYVFTVGSDDGARLSLDGKAVVDQPWLRSYAESKGDVHLAAGPHAIEVLFYENFGYASCRLWWAGPSWRRRLVTTEFLTPPQELARVTPPVLAVVLPSSGSLEDVVTLRGVGFSPDATADRVTFANVPAEIVSASPETLVVKVPIGAATGNVVVQVGELSSRPRRFTVHNVLGLYGEYFRLDGEIHQYADLERLTPYFVRLDPRLDFLHDNLWRLPFDPDVFASRHRGFLYAPADDDYRITLGSDDGARVRLDEKPYLDMPGEHGYQEETRTTRLAKGFHPIEVEFFENRGDARLALYWQRASEVTRSVVPEGFLFAPREIVEMPVPQIASLAPSSAEIGAEVEIVGSGFGTSAQLVRVDFPGEVWARPISVAEDRLRVRVPYGASSGELRVEVAIQSSNRLRFVVATQQGLVADYFTFTDRDALVAAATPDALSKLTPSFTRIESDWQRTAAKDWDLPFPADALAVHWHGTLALEYPADIGWILRAASGAWLSVDGGLTVDCGPWHDLEERYGWSRIAPGEHRFDLWLVHAGVEPKIQLLHTPVGRLDHLPVPGRWFLPREPRTGR